jgi:geranylgeranyl diphosphate synthase type I
LAWVYEVMMQTYSNPHHPQATQTVHTMIQEVIIGQMIDVDLAIGEPTTMDILETKNRYKTGRYTIARPLVAGAQRAGAPQAQIDILRQIGEILGLAYQLRDDLIDILETEHDKTTFYDIQEGQQTLLTQYIYDHGAQEDKDLLSSCMGKPLQPAQITELKNIFHAS